MLAAVTHANIVRVVATGVYTLGSSKHLYYVMEYLGAKVLSLEDAIDRAPSANKISICLRALIDTASALQHVHELGHCHGDIKPSNVLVAGYNTSSPVIKLIDFGFASPWRKGNLAGRRAGKSSSKHRPENCATPHHTDVWQLAHSIWRILYDTEKELRTVDKGECPWPIDSADYSELKNLVIEWSSSDSGSAPEKGETGSFFATLRRLTARYDLRQLAPNLRGAVRYLQIPEIATVAHLAVAYEAIRLPPRQLVLYTERIKKLITLPEVGVLRFTRQLGFTHLAYPGALGTRFEHSLGVYYLACRFLTRMAAEESFRSVCKDPIVGLKFILAALLHDIGHFPFAHQIEEFSDRDFSKGSRQRRLHKFIGNHGAHRHRGRELFNTALRPHLKSLFELSDTDLNDIETLAFTKRGEAAVTTESVIFLHSLLDGHIDLDKLDYVERDAHHCGVPYGNYLDVARLLETMRIVRIGKGGRPILAFDWRGVGCLEQLATARHQMYANVYWHRAVRAASTMFKHAFFLYARLVSKRTLEDVFFNSHADDAVLAAMVGLRGIDARGRMTREALAIRTLIDAVSGHRRALYKEVFETEHIAENVEPWGFTHSEQRETAQRLFHRLMKDGFLGPQANEIAEHNILVDCHADTSPAFDLVPIINHQGDVIRLSEESRIIIDLKENFQKQACRVRVFINEAALDTRFQQRKHRVKVQQSIEAFLREKR